VRRADDVRRAEAVGENLATCAARDVDQALAERVIGVDHSDFQLRPREELRLGCAVGGHRAVIIEMIARQIGEQGDIERHAADASLFDAV
jgi:hypothetical protein